MMNTRPSRAIFEAGGNPTQVAFIRIAAFFCVFALSAFREPSRVARATELEDRFVAVSEFDFRTFSCKQC